MAIRLEEDHPSIVVLGGFDPRRFHPQWFRAEKLLGEVEAEQAEIRFVTEQISDWSAEWFDLQVTQNRLLVVSKVESRAESLRDLVIGILQLLDQTVTLALGLNRSMHFDVGGEQSWNRVGDTLAPKALWQPHLPKRPGLRTLQIEETTRADGLPGRIVVSVQPSLKYTHGVYFDVNHEIRPQGERSTPFFLEVLRDHWERLLVEAKKMAEDLLERAQR